MASSNTIIQTIVDEDKRGRVMSFYMMAFLGTVPFGSLIAGWMSSRIGAPHTLRFGGVCCLAGAAWFATELPEDPRGGAADLRADGDPAAGRGRHCRRRGAVGAAGETVDRNNWRVGELVTW